MSNQIRVLFLAAEADPLVKIGGLGDMAGSFPAALRALPESPDVRLVLPFYPQIKKAGLDLKLVAGFYISHIQGPILAEVFRTIINGVPTYLVDGVPIAESPAVYSGDTNTDGTKFTFFSLAAMQLVKILNWQPDILHAHDWHAFTGSL